MATTLGKDNPFRYKGYYYDTETGRYYLNGRYYGPNICRFVNADNAKVLALTFALTGKTGDFKFK